METSEREWNVVIDGRSPLAGIYAGLAIDAVRNAPQSGGMPVPPHLVLGCRAVSFGHPQILEAHLKPGTTAGNLMLHTVWIPYGQVLAVTEVSRIPAAQPDAAVPA